jgi:hypothetical protein
MQQVDYGDEILSLLHLPPGLESEVHQAIAALASGEGVEPSHISTILYCSSQCQQAFINAYIAYFSHHLNESGEVPE